jgi:hypothetical protein
MDSHLDTLRQGASDAAFLLHPTLLSLLLPPLIPASPTLMTPPSKVSLSLLTGGFPVKSVNGHEYILVTVHHGYIHFTPLKTRSSASYVSAFSSVITFFQSLSHPLIYLQIDNETSDDLTAFFRFVSLPFQ